MPLPGPEKLPDLPQSGLLRQGRHPSTGAFSGRPRGDKLQVGLCAFTKARIVDETPPPSPHRRPCRNEAHTAEWCMPCPQQCLEKLTFWHAGNDSSASAHDQLGAGRKNPASRELVYATAGADLQVILDNVRERLRTLLPNRVVPQLQRAQRVIPPERTGQSCDALRAHVVAAHVQRHQ